MKSSSNLFPSTFSAKKLETLQKEHLKTKKNTKKICFYLSEEDKKLIQEVKNQGNKITEEDVIFIFKDKDGKIRWLEKGKSKSESKLPSGMKHIQEEHGPNFNEKGIPTLLIPNVIKMAVKKNNIVGISGRDRNVYETIFNGKVIHLAITIGSNGYIVGANPVSTWKEKK